MELIFDWDPRKAEANRRKHGLSFERAKAVFQDPLARIFADEWHSELEHRELIIGRLADRQLALVVFVEQPPGRVRIISARYATPRERRDYERNVQ